MAVLNFHAAQETVRKQILEVRSPQTETVPLLQSVGRIAAEAIAADRDFPPFARATRDGYAVRSGDVASVPVSLRVVGEVRAGSSFDGKIGNGQCVEIMTGAPVPEGADAVVMVEYTTPGADAVEIGRSVSAGENVVARGSEARQGEPLLGPGRRISYGEVAMMAAVGKRQVAVYGKPSVAILPTGDEVVELGASPGPFQIRNSNSYSLQAQVVAAGGVPRALGIAPDEPVRLREMISEGLHSDVLLLSGGVSAGKFDLVEPVLQEFGAEIFFEGVAMQPGRPLVFGRAQESFVFGLPGNPLSTMVTFELFVRPALALLAGAEAAFPVPLRARLGKDLRRKAGLMAFLPALLTAEGDEPSIRPVEWKGSGDIASLTRGNCYLIVPEKVSELRAGEWVAVLPRE